MFVRKKTNRSGTISVVVVSKAHGKFTEVKKFGVAKSEEEAELAEAAAATDVLPRTRSRLRGARALEDHLRAFAAGDLHDLLDRVHIESVDRVLRAELLRERETLVVAVARDDVTHAHAAHEREQQEADRTAALAEDVKPDPEADKKDQKDSKKVQLSKKEIEKQMKDREAAERKRVSKLARLYNEMKPADSAAAMDQLDDDTCIAILQRMEEGQAAKILAEFDASKTARLTKIMYEGKQKTLTSPSDLQKMIEQGQDAGQADGQNGTQTAQNQ